MFLMYVSFRIQQFLKITVRSVSQPVRIINPALFVTHTYTILTGTLVGVCTLYIGH